MSFWKKKDNLVITGFVVVFFIGLIVWYDLCCVKASFFTANSGNSYSIAFIDENDSERTLDSFKGKPLVVYVWATWCPSCVKKMGTLNSFAKKFEEKGGKVIALSQDKGGISTVRAYFTRHDYKNLDIFIESTGRLASALNVAGLPTAIFIDAQGKEVGRFAGGVDWESDKINELIQSYYGINLAQ